MHTPPQTPLIDLVTCAPSSSRRAATYGPDRSATVCCFKMADGLRTGESLCIGDVIEKSAMMDIDNGEIGVKNDSVNDNECVNVDMVSVACDSDKLFKNLCSNNDRRSGSKQHEGILPCEDDCRKKRCVDRYDSSESSDRLVQCYLTI